MSNQATTETLGGISRSGRVRKKSTKLMESLEISKSSVKSEKALCKTSPAEKKPLICGISPPPSDTISPIKMEVANFPPDEYEDDGHIEEDMVTETVTTTERLPLSAEGLPLAVPASGYYTYQGQFSHVLPKTESTTKVVKKKAQKGSKDKLNQQLALEVPKTDFLNLQIVKEEPECSSTNVVDGLHQEQASAPVKKKKTTKFKDIMAGADWDKLKKKKKKKKEKEKLAKAMKMNEMKSLTCPSDMLNADNDDSNSGSVGLVIAEPVISLPPKKRKKSGSETKKSSGEPKKKSGEGRKAKKAKASKPSNEDLVISDGNVNDGTNVGVKLEQLAEGGTIEDSDIVPVASESVVASQYLTEKKKARRPKEKFIIDSDGVVTTKKRRPRPITAYMLWCKENRPKIVAEDPSKSKDFAAISRRMGEVWQTLTDKEKMSYRRRAKKIGRRGTMISTGKKSANKQNQQAASKVQQGARRLAASGEPSAAKLHSSTSSDPVPIYKVTGNEPIDVAAHMKLLGESLTIIGQRLTENEGQIAVSGSLSVLLDSTLCALGPLLCLTNQIPEMDGIDSQTQASCLDSIAYVMPGL